MLRTVPHARIVQMVTELFAFTTWLGSGDALLRAWSLGLFRQPFCAYSTQLDANTDMRSLLKPSKSRIPLRKCSHPLYTLKGRHTFYKVFLTSSYMFFQGFYVSCFYTLKYLKSNNKILSRPVHLNVNAGAAQPPMHEQNLYQCRGYPPDD